MNGDMLIHLTVPSVNNLFKYIAIVQEYGPQVAAKVQDLWSTIKAALTEAGVIPAVEPQNALLGGGKLINLILTNLPQILAFIQQLTADAQTPPEA